MKNLYVARLFWVLCLGLGSACSAPSDSADVIDLADAEILDRDPICPGPPWAALGGEQARALETSMDEAKTEMALIGTAFGVADYEDKRVWSGASGFSDLEREEPWESSRSFRIGSVSKTFTTAAIYTLVDEGLLTIDDSIDDIVSSAYDGKGVTIRHLLNHTSGIPSYNYINSFDDTRSWSPTELLSWAETYGPDMLFVPGAEWRYSNTNFVLLGLVVEAIAQQPFDTFLQERFLCPLGLNDTYMANDASDPNVVQSYSENGEVIFVDPAFGWAAGGMVSTPNDLARWGAELFGGELLSPESRAQMLTPVDPALTDSSGGHGVFVEYGDGVALFGHTGGIGGFQTYMYYWESDKIALVAVANRLQVNLRDLAFYGWRELIDVE